MTHPDHNPDGGQESRPCQLVLCTSLHGLLTAALAPALLAGFGVAALSIADQLRALPAALTVLGLVLALGLLMDMPVHVRFDELGVTRRCVLRRHTLHWQQIVAVERAPTSAAGGLRRAFAQGTGVPTPGLVARGVNGRRYLLTDRSETPDEHERLVQLLSRLDLRDVLRARPPADAALTWSARRRRG